MPIMLATYSTNKIIVLKRYVSERRREKEINFNQTNTLTQRQTYALRTQNYTKKEQSWQGLICVDLPHMDPDPT